MIKLISLDLDGTLLDPEGKITTASKAAIAKARAAGLRVVINTGRDCHEAAWFAQAAGCDTLTSSTGGGIVSDGGQALRRWDVEKGAARQALRLALSWDIDLMIFAGEHTLVNTKYKKFLEQNYPFPAFHQHAVVTDDPVSYMEEHRLPLTKLHGELDPSLWPVEQLKAIEGVFLTTSSDHDFELVSTGVNKARSLALIATLYGIPLEQCAAVGDSANDLEALQAVGLPIAMGNAPQRVRDAAVRVAPSNGEDGAAWAVLSCLA